VLFNSLVPGFEQHGDFYGRLVVGQQTLNLGDGKFHSGVPNIQKITIFVDEIFKSIDQHSVNKQFHSIQRFVNPNSFNMNMPAPTFSVGLFEHVQAGGLLTMTSSERE